MTDQLYLSLHDGTRIPQVGLGVWQTPDNEAAPAVKAALDAGYRHVDTAAVYENEQGVGEGIRQSGLPRSDIFLTTKLWNTDQGYEQTLKAFEASLKRLGTDYVDLYLIHWPSAHRGLFVDTWKALVSLKEEGRAKSIGVSNFYPEHIEKIVAETGVVPVINQIELHPDFQQRETRAFHEKHKIATQSWSPLGQGKLLGHPVIAEIAQKLGRTPAQVIIRWHIENGLVVIPKSVTPSRIVENFKVFDFKLSAEDLDRLNGLDDAGARIGPDPKTATF
ncbi:2,5-diketo-D-gluconate reductase A [Peteryoungia aggregata LMG 23059]|uniref:2,5-diketo-D-gluconate reductase A n=1 Tax=Peteryoungia aggregata LMG 23059 TaxID=1368425 RepID=A0ABU0GAS3_9HYPH|nr:aldo/keto reductase [Peteryoungia aggregata]MDQ0422198.1 2,5-diketo-D-gluconate reductase A [Peteryoungia aggregata LMG 23059]